ncbi:MAG: histidinol-phosphatase [Muribaculaceae bacterium]|nr:histidinol-phosphatase [Muribaculaceae bacterium]
MTPENISELIKDTNYYNFHSHTQFCDGRAPMEVMAQGAHDAGMKIWGFTPHSPLCQQSPCNMAFDNVEPYLQEAERLKALYDGKMNILTSLEIDYMSPDFGPHIDYFQNLPLDYRLGSVHFVPSQEGVWLDCDGSYERFEKYLNNEYKGDLRYVVERYFEQVLMMIERGGFDILGHFDKIAGNAALSDPDIENYGWYESLVDDVISHALTAGVLVEINTKSLLDKKRFFPANRWWKKLIDAKIPLVINSDAHYPDRVNAGRNEAMEILNQTGK